MRIACIKVHTPSLIPIELRLHSRPDPTTVFSYAMEQRLQCGDCKKVRYRLDNTDVVSTALPAKEKGKDEDGKSIYQEVQLTDCLESLLGMESLEYACPSCSKKVQAFRYVAISRVNIFSSFLRGGIYQANQIRISTRRSSSSRKEVPSR